MKKYLSHILVSVFLLTILVGVGGSVLPHHIAYAQDRIDSEAPAQNPTAPTMANPNGTNANGTSKESSGSWWTMLNPLTWLTTALGAVAVLVLKVLSGLTAISGIILNYVVKYTVVDMSLNYSRIGAISSAWGTVRDVANMGFIFILLYASIQMILGEGKDTRKLIVNIIIAALLINFSMFFTQVVIDASNIIALTFYHAIAPNATTDGILNAGISNAMMRPLNLQSIWDASSAGGFSGTRLLTIGVMGSVVTLIAAFVFLAIALMFVIRYVVLILVLILSPIAAIGDVIPGASGYAADWRKALFGQAFFAPVYMLLTWVTISIFQSMPGGGNGNGNLANALAGTADDAGNISYTAGSVDVLMNFAVVIVFLIATLILSKKVSDSAGQGINKLTSKALGLAGGASFGLASRMGRSTVGAGAELFKNSEMYKRLEAKSSSSMGARLALAAADKTSRASFDFRATGVGGEIGGILEAGGPSGKGGFEADLKGAREFLERPGTEAHKKRLERGRKAQAEIDIREGINAAPGTPEYEAMEKAISAMSGKEISAIVESNRKLLNNQVFANNISVKQLEALNSSEKLSESEQQTLKDNRFGTINTEIDRLLSAPTGTPIDPDVAKSIGKLSDKEIEMLDPTRVMSSHFVLAMKDSQIEAIGKSDRFNRRQKDAIGTERDRPLKDSFTTANWPTAIAEMEKRGASIASMPIYDPAHPDVPSVNETNILEIYTPSLLNKMVAQKEMTPAKAVAIRSSLTSSLSPVAMTALADLQTPRPGTVAGTTRRLTTAERQAILSALNARDRRMVTSVEWLDSENGQQLFG